MSQDSRERVKRRKGKYAPFGRHTKTVGATTWSRRSQRRGTTQRQAVVLLSGAQGKVISNPALDVAYRLRARTYVHALVRIYDPAGRLIATVDPVTRIRTPI